MTTIMLKTITLNAQPTDAPLLMEANDASKKPAPAAKGSPVGNGNPAPVTLPKNDAAAAEGDLTTFLLWWVAFTVLKM